MDLHLPSVIATSYSQESTVLNRLYGGYRYDDCPWYILRQDPELVSFVPDEYLIPIVCCYAAEHGEPDCEIVWRVLLRLDKPEFQSVFVYQTTPSTQRLWLLVVKYLKWSSDD